MAKLSASALRTAAANTREKNAENAVMNPSMHEVVEKNSENAKSFADEGKNEQEDSLSRTNGESFEQGAASTVKTVLKSYESERKTEHVNLLITPSLSKKIEIIRTQGEFRSKNAAVIAVLEAFCDANGID